MIRLLTASDPGSSMFASLSDTLTKSTLKSQYIFSSTEKVFTIRKLITLSQTTYFRLFKLKEFADDNFKFDENGRMFSKQVENTVGKGEIAHYEQFLLFPWCFQKICTVEM